MLKRIITSIVLFPVLAYLVFLGGLPLKYGCLALSVIGMYEIYRALAGGFQPIHVISYIFIALYYMGIDAMNGEHLLILIFLYIMFNLIYLVLNHTKTTPPCCAANIFGFFYVGLLMSGIYLTRMASYGQYFVWLIFISAWGSDTFAYFTGVTFGKHKLTPKLSPNKTVEGSIGGILGAVLLALVYGFLLNKILVFDEINIVFLFVVVAGTGAVFSQLGDLTASAIKRFTNIKDYGKIIPGHGGVIDRFDSVLFTAPIAYIVMYFLVHV